LIPRLNQQKGVQHEKGIPCREGEKSRERLRRQKQVSGALFVLQISVELHLYQGPQPSCLWMRGVWPIHLCSCWDSESKKYLPKTFSSESINPWGSIPSLQRFMQWLWGKGHLCLPETGGRRLALRRIPTV